MMNNAAVVVEKLRVVRGKREVLPDLSLTVPRGQVVGLLGPSGGGKSTLLRAIVGVQIVKSGTITVLGEPAGSRNLRSRVGYVTQEPSVFQDLTVRQNLAYFAKLVSAAPNVVDEVLSSIDLDSHADSHVANLSGGQRSRVSLGAALVGAPELLILDEPTVGLDPVLRRDLWELFHRLAGAGTTLLVSSHVMDEATRCHRLLLLREGKILADETPNGLLEKTGATDAEGAFLRLISKESAK
ncbi:ABC-2 type transport system ATP-binding protein [Antricoccus suffuscus]|uniref:ABC-2 type transport system ATP-binding protein n=1 Tax=Antricoccus suffuscus TaxID=1629062 RepID=A0A2T0ZW28_9ACTN|nr:ABC transporter ATP-binding protein [Antricoccus suffuscus]PRZ40559.1 ABC-2 type transport system ATP-binding protein [Antricoccus suffuscus]